MNHLQEAIQQAAPSTPLVNLFAYIRDLFHTAQPELSFDDTALSKQKVKHWVPLKEILFLRDQAVSSLNWQAQHSDKPLLKLKRKHVQDVPALPDALEDWIETDGKGGLKRVHKKNVTFSQSSNRVDAYQTFYQEVHGKKLDEVQHVTIPDELDQWITLDAVADKVVVNKVEVAEEVFEADELRVELWKAYERNLKNKDNSRDFQIRANKIYDNLHDWYYRLKAEPELQLFLSFGLFQGGTGKNSYKNYLFHVPLKVDLNRQELTLTADTVARTISCEQHFTELIPIWFSDESEHMHEQRQREVIRYIDTYNSQRRDFTLDPEDLKQQYQFAALDLLGIFPQLEDRFFEHDQLNYDFPEKKKDEARFMLSFSPIIQLRHPGNHINVSKDAANIIQTIQSLNKGDKQKEVPSFFRKMFSLNKAVNPLRIVHKNKGMELNMKPIVMEEKEPRFYFPLPYNEEQLAIAKRLLKEDAASVQGPPGTGKSHTIANLAAHYAAMGKSVLIVSKYAKALEVIKGKLPADIRDLAISFADNEQHREALKHSIDAVKAKLNDRIDLDYIDLKEEAMDRLEAEFDMVLLEVQEAIAKNQSRLMLYDIQSKSWREEAISYWFAQYQKAMMEETLIWDDLDQKIDTPAIAKALVALYEQGKDIDFSLCKLFLPAPEHLPQVEEAEEWGRVVNHFRSQIDGEAYKVLPVTMFGQQTVDQWKELKNWLPSLIKHKGLFGHPTFNLKKLNLLLKETAHSRAIVRQGAEEYLATQVELDNAQQQAFSHLRMTIDKLLGKFNKHGQLPGLKRRTLSSAEKEIMAIWLNGKQVESKVDLLLLQKWLEWKQEEARITKLASNYLALFGEKLSESSILTLWDEWEKSLDGFDALTKWNDILRENEQQAFMLFGPDQDDKIAFYDGLEICREYRLSVDRLRALATRIPADPQGHPLILKMREQLLELDVKGYRDSFETYIGLTQQTTEAKELYLEFEAFTHILPETVRHIAEHGIQTVPTVEQMQEHLNMAQLKKAVRKFLPEVEGVQSKIEQLRSIGRKKSMLAGELVSLRAWYHRQKDISDEQRSALSAWRNDLINLGKGYGKNSAQHLKSAIKNLQLAKEVVPIWIMSLDAAIRFFPDPKPGQFDLLIIDEASQVDISALNLIFRASKSLVVGDENQTSVFTNSALFPIERTNQILDRYLSEHPFKQQFNINNRTASIYSLAGVIYPNIISLKEHFRCRPEIISFSNKFVYGNNMIPLRTPTHQWFGAAAEVKYLEDEARNKKKPAIVREVIRLIEEVIEEYEAGTLLKLPTIGILCLDSSNEPHREAIRAALFKSSSIKSYQDQLKLLIGTSREFQGDERDVMILTTTASHTLTKAGVMRPPRAVKGEEMMRIYNVAVSRAREKIILLHTIHPEAVAIMKPECYRGRLINHLMEVAKSYHEQDKGGPRRLPSSPMIETISAWLQHTYPEWDVKTDYRIGPYKMDIALLSEKGKIALWCDEGGNENQLAEQLKQQLVLERAGWNGFRIQSLSWFTRKEQVIASLREMIDQKSEAEA
ncbi:MAG: AAA family ATPase [Bacteroidota bacterium]